MAFLVFFDTILVPLSVFISIGYHAFLLHNLRNKPFATTIGMNMLKRRSWLKDLNQGDDKKGMLAVQSLRNSLMSTILTATVTILITIAMGALANNAFKANHLLRILLLTTTNSDTSTILNTIFGSQSVRLVIIKYGGATILLLASFFCSSMAIGCLIDACFLINAIDGNYELLAMSPKQVQPFSLSCGYTQRIVERGFMLAIVGNRLLCVTFPLLLWMLGPVAVVVASLGLVFALYALDFITRPPNCPHSSSTTASDGPNASSTTSAAWI
ncbi:hypothetical protein LIER_10663 [Lithospermum erythrorhizon]|uniref:Uncharacterized protein n=1 Tax=Lithospermum erythrorhizon TaxID=34254 RepID=A0AAV3PLU7_LITER